MIEKVICWDMDETLGSFRRIGYELAGEQSQKFEKPTGIRHGIKECLNRLSSDGYIHFVTTLGSTSYAREALGRVGLITQFKDVLGNEVMSKGMSSRTLKNYRVVADRVGFSDDEAFANMIVIGDSYNDKPLGIDGLVFLMDKGCQFSDSIVTEIILKKLRVVGKEHFQKGFEFLYGAADIKKETFGRSVFETRTFDIGNGIKLKLDYATNKKECNAGDLVVPVIEVLEVGDYKRDIQIL